LSLSGNLRMNSRFPKAEIGGTGTLVSGSVLVVLTVLIVFVLSSQVAAFSFAVFGDNQGRTETYKLLIKKLNADKSLSFAISAGDLTGYGTLKEYKTYKALNKSLHIPVYQTMGNHDAVNGGWRNFWQEFGRPYYAFVYENAKFIVLDNSFAQSFDAEQLAWLEAELANNLSEHLFVIMHKPVFDPSEIYKDHIMSGRAIIEKLMKLFEKFGVDYVFTGHIHGYAKSERNGVTYIVTGGAGAPLYLPPEFGGFYHYVKVTVDDGKIKDEIRMLYE